MGLKKCKNWLKVGGGEFRGKENRRWQKWVNRGKNSRKSGEKRIKSARIDL